MSVLDLSVTLALVIVLGFAARKLRVIPDGFSQPLSRFVISISLPCLIISTFFMEFSVDDLISSGVLIALSVVVLALSAVIGQIVYLVMKKTASARVARYALIFTNYTFFGIPMVSMLYGAKGLMFYTAFTLPVRFAYYSSAGPLLAGNLRGGGIKAALKNFFSAPIIGVIIGLVIYLTRVSLPPALTGAVELVAKTASPLGMILCGATLADTDLKGLFKRPSIFVVSVLRLIVIPALALGVAVLAGVDKLLAATCVMYAAMPVASLIPTFVLRWIPGDAEAASEAGGEVFVSTLVCIATVPLWVTLIERLL